mmetsp:Transcript_10990/g.19226  ORF Transcript_10990/g.19226 Transcript_10990/m.19226 type:complete len:223 (+) Transcript_10990:699-1367(+)
MRRFLRKARADTPAPENIPAGMRNMLATLCSTPMVTNAMTGIQQPRILPVVSFADVALRIARQTRELQMMPCRNNWMGSLVKHLATASAAEYSPTPGTFSRPAPAARAAHPTPPTRFPSHDTPQFLAMSPSRTRLASNADPVTIVLPVNISEPVRSTSCSPKGKKKAPAPFTIAGGRPASWPEIVTFSNAATPMNAPAMMPRMKVLKMLRFAFVSPIATCAL